MSDKTAIILFFMLFRLVLPFFVQDVLDIVGSKQIPIVDYIKNHGYPVETHEITTEDGYILSYHRIPHGKSSDVGRRRKPVLLQHGLLCSSAVWVLQGDSLGYLLADKEFDVWLGNARGNTYSRRHTRYDPDKNKRAFWDFSWHEMGYYDLPASIDYILNVTKSRQLFYIGHSMGTTMFFVLGATRPDYMAKIEAAVLLAPVAYPYNIHSPVLITAISLLPLLVTTFELLGVYEVFPSSPLIHLVDNLVCSHSLLQFFCTDLLDEIAGFDDQELNRTALPTYLQYIPAGASVKQMKHYGQIVKKGSGFRQFDYGLLGNLKRYKSLKPPKYNLNYVNAPVYIHYSHNDFITVPEDVFSLVQKLPNVKSIREVPDYQFNHVDYIWAIDAKELLYDNIIETLHKLTLS